jgi:hypothetical protein
MLVLDMIEILPLLGKYKYDTWRILLVKCYIDIFVHLRSCIRNVNKPLLSLVMFATFILVLFYRYDRVTTPLCI